jgi:uncharacterized membrane protein YccC
MLTVQATVLESVRTAFQRTIGVVCGVLLAYLLASALGVHWWSVGILVFLGLLLGQSLALGASGSTQIAVSALLVLVAASGSNSYATDRILDTLIGAAVGVVVSLVLVPPLHVRDSAQAIRHFADAQAAVLCAIAEGLRTDWPGEGTSHNLEQARALQAELSRTRTQVDRGAASTRYNVRSRASRPAVGLQRATLRRLAHAEIMVLGIARTLADEAEANTADENPDPPLPDELRDQLVAVLIGAADTLRKAGETAVNDESTVASREALEALHAASSQTATEARALVRAARRSDLPARQWLILGSLLTDLRRIVAEIDDRAEPLELALTGGRRRRPVRVRRKGRLS